jgi:outer membrane protein
MRSSSLLALLALLPTQLVLAQVPTPGDSSALSLEEAIRTAQQNNPAFLTVKNNLRNADAAVKTSRGSLLPQLSAGFNTRYTQGGDQFIQGIRFAGPASYSSGYNVGLDYNINAGLAFAPRAAKAQRAASQADIVNQAENLRATVTQQYILTAQGSALAAVLDTLVTVAQGQLDLANAKMEAGAGTIIDVRTAEVALGQARVAALTQHNAARLDKLRLFEQMGVPADTAATLTTTFSTTVPSLSLDSLLSLAHRANPDLLARQSRLRADEATVKLQKTQYLPSLRLSTGYGGNAFGYANTDAQVASEALRAAGSFRGCMTTDSIRIASGLAALGDCGSPTLTSADIQQIREGNRPFSFAKAPYSLSAFVSLPIFNGFQREANIEQARVQRDNAELDLRARNLQLTTAVTQAYLTLETQRQTVELQTQTAAKAAEDLALMQESFKVGARTFLEVTTARANYEKAQIDRVNAIYQYQASFAALENAVGRPLR